jgi:hypothetical protein
MILHRSEPAKERELTRSASDSMATVKIMFAPLGAYGHLYPMMPLALACADAGHDVMIATGKPFLDRLPLPTSPAIRTASGSTGRFRKANGAIPICTVGNSVWRCSPT